MCTRKMLIARALLVKVQGNGSPCMHVISEFNQECYEIHVLNTGC